MGRGLKQANQWVSRWRVHVATDFAEQSKVGIVLVRDAAKLARVEDG